jgi:hypothetical protein
MPRRPDDYTGRRFGHLTVLRMLSERKRGYAMWLCRCDCGKYKKLQSYLLRLSKSCGCRQTEPGTLASTKHGHIHKGKRSPEYRTWSGIKTRCENPRSKDYAKYGAAGLYMCAEWRKSFVAFFEHMGPRPSSRHRIDRIDNSRGYEPGNCRWATFREQTENRKYTIWVVFNGKKMPLARACELAGLNYCTVQSRIWRGMTPEKALSFPRTRPDYRWASKKAKQ